MIQTRWWLSGVACFVSLAACKAKNEAPATRTSAAPPAATALEASKAPEATQAAPRIEARALRLGKPPKAPVPLADYFKLWRVRGPARFNHDESLVAYRSDEGGRLEIWVQPVAGGAARAITRTKGSIHAFEFSPSRDQLVFGADQGGDEMPRLYETTSRGDPPKLLVEEPKGARTQLVRFSDDGEKLAYLSSRRDPKYMDLYELDLRTKKSTLLWKAEGKKAIELVSRDLRRFTLIETLSDSSFRVWLAERGAKAPVLLTPHTGEVAFAATSFSHDGAKVFFTSDEEGEFSSLWSVDLATKARTRLLSPPWDVDSAAPSRAGKYFVTVTNVDGTPQIEVVRSADQTRVALPKADPRGTLIPIAWSKSDRFAAATFFSDAAPLTVYVLDLEKGTARALVDPMPASLRDRPMVGGRTVRIPSFDDRPVPAFLYTPPGDGPFPAIIDVHGGPTAQAKKVFVGYRQYFLSKGWAVLVPNVRGSTGYGKTWMKADNLDLGGGPLKDVVACKKWLAQNARVDPKRVVVLGGSYGGYMALAAAAFTPGEFAAQVDLFGPSDLKTLVESFPPYWAAYATFIYRKFGDPKNPAHAAYQRERSPIHFVDRIRTPVLVVQGKHDLRVRRDQSDRIVAKLREKKVPVHYLLLDDEGHGFDATQNFERVIATTDRFLDRYVWEDTSVTVE